MDEIISYKNQIIKSLIINGFSKKKYGIEQNHAQKAFMISKLHKNVFVKKVYIREISCHYTFQRISTA